MATLEEVTQALINADKAGRKEDAAILAKEYMRLKNEQQPSMSAGEVASSAFQHLPESAYNNLIKYPVEFVKKAATDPGGAIGDILSPIAGAALKIPGGRALDTAFGGTPERQQINEANANAIGEFYKQRYGSMEGFKNALATDPMGIATDAAAVVSPVSRATGLAARTPALLKVPLRAAVNPIGETIGLLGKGASHIPRTFMGPAERAAENINDIASRYPNASQDLNNLGREGILADVLGQEGERRARMALNVSPEAGDILDRTKELRSAGKADRLLSVEEDVRAAHRPGIDQAYQAAKRQGASLPRQTILSGFRPAGQGPQASLVQGPPTPIYTQGKLPAGFEDVIQDPLLKPFWNQAVKLTDTLTGIENQGDFARIDKFRSLLNKARFKLERTDPTKALAFQSAVEAIDNELERASISPGREAARKAHQGMKIDLERQLEEQNRRERRFARTHNKFTGNSSTVQQGMDVGDVMSRSNIVGDIMGGHFIRATAKVFAWLANHGYDADTARRLAPQMIEEAKLLVGRTIPQRPTAALLSEQARSAASNIPQAILLGSKTNQILGGGGGY